MSLLLNILFETDSYSNEYLVAIIGFDTAEDESSEVCPLAVYRSRRCLRCAAAYSFSSGALSRSRSRHTRPSSRLTHVSDCSRSKSRSQGRAFFTDPRHSARSGGSQRKAPKWPEWAMRCGYMADTAQTVRCEARQARRNSRALSVVCRSARQQYPSR